MQSAQKIDTKQVVTKDWYASRYERALVQRNIALAIVILNIILCCCLLAVTTYVMQSKSFDPFIIQLDNKTGETTVVQLVNNSTLEATESLSRYFVKKYVTARETYNSADFAGYSRNVVRLMSTSDVYWQYVGIVTNKDRNPETLYGTSNSTYLTVKSWSKLAKNKLMLRFALTETAGARRVFNKLAIVDFDYVPTELKEKELDINPVGFQVKGYRVDDDNS
ncbi:Type IV secretion system protein VirB8 [Rickettsiales endosymbiont of Paramecium tredecaurelia]|uniref:virB8 family protein n=1 Tax=Candidatus Sarmatiella mevalonica TaxID=2770581 RepID=UPI001923B349|nr:VirB8/TrbF family protein [Candidatus Sarmatiella mevalonica]MBL3284913.1 Type IV secretion system protein VirB8 [Candidatus Sarmatiella mevalonica]